jgi:hypothetical protein
MCSIVQKPEMFNIPPRQKHNPLTEEFNYDLEIVVIRYEKMKLMYRTVVLNKIICDDFRSNMARVIEILVLVKKVFAKPKLWG